ncbi:MAG: sulfite exporter TauE/SafE family protein [Alphaproteobacteria bacterium]|nr:sulfite exporter TauE/SafE family protein [Alphaproteobacteria bacterium]
MTALSTLPSWAWLPALTAAVLVFLAAIVRGYSAFGFSLLAITALSLVYPPAEIIPSIFLLEIAASLHLLPGLLRDIRDIHWRSVGLLLAGTTVGTPLGVALLTSLPAPPMKLALAAFVLISTALLWHGFALARMPSRTATVAIGAAAGAANGAFGIG